MNAIPIEGDPLVRVGETAARTMSAADELPTRDLGGPRFSDDPEDLALRTAPPRIVRFRKGLLVASAAAGFVLLAVISWFALDPASLKLAATERDLVPALEDTPPEALESLPLGYGAASTPPVLGPPLPGDLGRPILAHQREMAREAGADSSSVSQVDSAAAAAVAERERHLADIAQARNAPILMQVSRGAMERSGSGIEPTRPGGSQVSHDLQPDEFVNAARLQPPASRWQVSAGSTIAASLITGLNSDLPGIVIAQVTEPVFDSATGATVLIPQGARLLGRYASKIAFGQRRAMLEWERLLMPDGSSIMLDNAPATDAAGFAGLSDRTDLHSWQLLKGVGLSTLLGVGTELNFGDGEADLMRALRESAQSNGDRAGQKIVERNLDVAPTIIIRPGFQVRVLVHKDLVLPPWKP